jgi:hypothetical protein
MMRSRQVITYSGNPECTVALGYCKSLANPGLALRAGHLDAERQAGATSRNHR